MNKQFKWMALCIAGLLVFTPIVQSDAAEVTNPRAAPNIQADVRPGSSAATAAPPSASTPSTTFEKPRLVLQITVDQFLGDLLTRYADRLGEKGLRYLLEEGIHYNNAHHVHAKTETIVGHVTLATGAHPAAHGMIGNIWFDRKTGVTTYNIEDRDEYLLSEGADTEIDPTQKAATSDGRSPRAILTTTFSDELASHTAGRAKIFGVSVKDRGAVSINEIRRSVMKIQSTLQRTLQTFAGLIS